MCLDKITIKKRLKKDLRVWKIVRVNSDGMEITPAFESVLKRRKNRAIRGKINAFCSVNKYYTGFHSYLSEKDAIDLLSPCYSVLHYIIPKRTVVQFGYQDGKRVAVSSILINPRASE